MPGESFAIEEALPDDIQSLADRRDLHRTMAATLISYLGETAKAVHRAVRTPDQVRMLTAEGGALLRNCPDNEGKERLPIWYVTTYHAARLGQLPKDSEIDELRKRYVRRDDLTDSMRRDENYQKAVVRVEKMMSGGFPQPYTPWQMPAHVKNSIPGENRARAVHAVREMLTAQLQFFRATTFIFNELLLDAQKKIAEIEHILNEKGDITSIKHIIGSMRASLGHVQHTEKFQPRTTEDKPKKPFLVSIPLLLGMSFNEAWTKENGLTQATFLAEHEPVRCEQWIREGRKHVIRGLEAARIYRFIAHGRDYSRIKGSQPIGFDENEEVKELLTA